MRSIHQRRAIILAVVYWTLAIWGCDAPAYDPAGPVPEAPKAAVSRSYTEAERDHGRDRKGLFAAIDAGPDLAHLGPGPAKPAPGARSNRRATIAPRPAIRGARLRWSSGAQCYGWGKRAKDDAPPRASMSHALFPVPEPY
jgi:hypothetical protein